MDISDSAFSYHWLITAGQLLYRLSVFIIIAVIVMRIEWLHNALHGDTLIRRHGCIAILLFGSLAVLATHSGVPVNLLTELGPIHLPAELPISLTGTQTVISLRDGIILAAGLIGGPWVGFGSGILAGFDIYNSGGAAKLFETWAIVALGAYAGAIRYWRPCWMQTAKGIFWVAFAGTLMQKIIVFSFLDPCESDLLALSWQVTLPTWLINTFGSVLLFWLIRDLDSANEVRFLAVHAELRALRAQIDPHFLNNTLNDLNSLIIFTPEKALRYVGLLARFFKFTRQFADVYTISLIQELVQVHRFLVLQQLELDDKLQYRIRAPKALWRVQVLPGCILTLVENAFKHGFKGNVPPYFLDISARNGQVNELLLEVTNNARDIESRRLQALGNSRVRSKAKGGGVALYQLARSLRLIFGNTTRLSFCVSDQGFTVMLKQPMKPKR